MTTEALDHYLELVKIRQKARRRDCRIVGGLFLVAFLATFGVGLVAGLNNRETYLVLAFDALFALVYIMAWVRLELSGETLELLENLKRWSEVQGPG